MSGQPDRCRQPLEPATSYPPMQAAFHSQQHMNGCSSSQSMPMSSLLPIDLQAINGTWNSQPAYIATQGMKSQGFMPATDQSLGSGPPTTEGHTATVTSQCTRGMATVGPMQCERPPQHTLATDEQLPSAEQFDAPHAGNRRSNHYQTEGGHQQSSQFGRKAKGKYFPAEPPNFRSSGDQTTSA